MTLWAPDTTYHFSEYGDSYRVLGWSTVGGKDDHLRVVWQGLILLHHALLFCSPKHAHKVRKASLEMANFHHEISTFVIFHPD